MPKGQILTKRVKDNEEIYAYDCEYAGAIERISWLYRIHGTVDPNVEHGKRLASASDYQAPLTLRISILV